MSVQPYPDYPAILAVLESLLKHAKPLQAAWYRCVETSFASQMLSGEGARQHGGRWNAIGSFRTVEIVHILDDR